jgi:integrase
MIELRSWMASLGGNDHAWLFPAARRRGSAELRPTNPNNYRNRILKPLAERAGIPDLDLLTLRRTCATHFGQKATPKDTQAQLRHADPWTTLKYYQQSIPESVKRAAVALESDIIQKTEYAGKSMHHSAKVVQ